MNNRNFTDGKDPDCGITICSSFCRMNCSLPNLHFQSHADESKIRVNLQLNYYCFLLDTSYKPVTHSAVLRLWLSSPQLEEDLNNSPASICFFRNQKITDSQNGRG